MPPSQPLLNLLFGTAASEILTISPRLELWSKAFSAWLDWIQSRHSSKTSQRALFCWRSLLDFLRCPPWDISADGIERWQIHLLSFGFRESTLKSYRGPISNFYRYCNRERLLETDPLFGKRRTQFNPVHEATYNKKLAQPEEVYGTAIILRPFEARALLRAIDRPTSILGKRDYAFLLTLLLTGLDEKRCRSIQWGAVRQSPEGVELALPKLRAGTGEAVAAAEAEAAAAVTRPLIRPLPQPAWKAILEYLTASGRLPEMKAEDYIFCPLADPISLPPDPPDERSRRIQAEWNRRQDWANDRPISSIQLYIILKTYAAWAGLDTRYVTFASLHHAAAVFMIQAGADDLDLQASLGCYSLPSTHRHVAYLAKMLARRGKRSPNPALSGRVILPPQTIPGLAGGNLAAPIQNEQAGSVSPDKKTRISPRKKTGAQPGNLHSLIHGFHYDGLLPGDRELLQFLFEDEKAIAQKGALFQMMEFLKGKADPSVKIPAEFQQKEEIKKMSQALGDPDMLRAEVIRLRLLFYRALRLTRETDNLPDMLRAVDQGGLAVGKILKLRRRLYPTLYPRPKKKKPDRWNRVNRRKLKR
jgi:site-specific recombinase XerD